MVLKKATIIDEIYRKHSDQGRENELQLFLGKIRRALKAVGDVYCDWFTLVPESWGEDGGKTMLDLLKEKGSFYYAEDGVMFDFQWDSHVYICIQTI